MRKYASYYLKNKLFIFIFFTPNDKKGTFFYLLPYILQVNLQVTFYTMKANLYIDKKPDKEGKHQVYCQITGSGKRAIIYLGVKVNPANWTGNSITRKEPNYDIKNSILQAKYSIISKIIAEAEINLAELSPDQIKEIYQSKISKSETEANTADKNKLVYLLEQYPEIYKDIHKHNTLRAFKQVADQVRLHDSEICIEDLSHAWLIGYCKRLVGLKLQDSTIKDRHLKSIKSVCREAMKTGVKVSEQVFSFKWKSQPKQPFFATWEEIEKIAKIKEFIMPIQEKIRDLFLLSCYTGLRNSDLSQITSQNIIKQGKQNLLKITLVKTGFDYAIPITQEVEQILAKYPKGIPNISQQECNRQIKNIAKIVVKGNATQVKSSGNKREYITLERHKLFTTHTGRRTFGRRFLDQGGSAVILAKIFGHKSIETTLKYIAYQPQEVIEEFQKVFR